MTEPLVWRTFTRPALDQAYDNSNAVPTSGALREERNRASAALKPTLDGVWDAAYGPLPRQRVDYVRCGRKGAPVLVFVHGGYWQRNDKEGSLFLAPGPLARGFDMAFVEYTLCPDTTLTALVDEVRAGVKWVHAHAAELGGDPARLVVTGNSAGGHLTACTMDMPEVAGGVAISGLYDLEPLRLNYLNDAIRMDAAEAAAMSPLLHLPAKAGPLVVAVGGAELPELVRQSREYHAAWTAAGLAGSYMELPGDDHFSILDHLARADGPLVEAALGVIGAA